MAGKIFARLGSFHLNWPEPVLFGWPERTKGKQSKYLETVKANGFIISSCRKTHYSLFIWFPNVHPIYVFKKSQSLDFEPVVIWWFLQFVDEI